MHAQPASPKKPCKVTKDGRHQAITWHGKVMCWICGARRVVGSREDDDYWNNLYDSAPDCEDEPDHGSDHMLYEAGRWFCCRCAYDDNQAANEEAYRYG